MRRGFMWPLNIMVDSWYVLQNLGGEIFQICSLAAVQTRKKNPVLLYLVTLGA